MCFDDNSNLLITMTVSFISNKLVYTCGGCGATLQAKKQNNNTIDTTLNRLDNNSSGKTGDVEILESVRIRCHIIKYMLYFKVFQSLCRRIGGFARDIICFLVFDLADDPCSTMLYVSEYTKIASWLS
ncbi:hypothetical protein HanHA300_Chr16g0597781 [Helianthus annuus]|nr:hypothetical protein HanHA300_Chr16g0597781 [Helianthus annuus]KAJ0459373.1 hypothetical protein HanHA89_Chr16g0648241 [Helianthus annuus]KAJ0643863.1 hypothetical protein HanOQP8_Chr16g0605341 [Helianthus annuus]